MDADADVHIDILVVPAGREVYTIKGQVTRTIAYLAQQSKRLGRIAPLDDEQNVRRFAYLRAALAWMDSDLNMTPQIKQSCKLDTIFKFMFDNPSFHFPDDIKDKAKELYDRWVVENWGSDLVQDEVNDSTEEAEEENLPSPVNQDTANGITTGSGQNLETTQVTLPSENDPLFGRQGIMYGVLLLRGKGGRKKYQLNPKVPKKMAQVFGHNGIEVGSWYPLQIVALHRGAHGSRMGGIAGSMTQGAYSIVVSSKYEDLDQDYGNTLYYSGSDSHDNEDPDQPGPSSNGTKALTASWQNQKPIRVLRSGGSNSSKATENKYLPSCGIRYDGLYRVADMLHKKNGRGGLYEQFKLVRDPDQPSLDEIRLSSPTPKQERALEDLQKL